MKLDITFTGGHHNSALVLAKALRARGYTVNWIGHKYASSSDKSLSAEYQEVVGAGIDFQELKTGKFYRQSSLFEWTKIIFGFFQAFYYLLKARPRLIYSSGGYLSVPVVITGFLLGIPSITHEQTVTAGWANKAISKFVKKILLTHPESLKNYPVDKSTVVGLPLRSELFDLSLKKTYTPPMIFIMCGKQGSHIINQAVFPLIESLLDHYQIIHQVGSNSVYKDLDRARRLKERLGKKAANYQFAAYFFEKDSASHLQSADMIICRAGAHTAYEAIVLNKKSILIPIPWVSHQEQLRNAELVTRYTTSIILPESELNSDSLKRNIEQLSLTKSKKVRHNLPLDAHQKTLNLIEEFLN